MKQLLRLAVAFLVLLSFCVFVSAKAADNSDQASSQQKIYPYLVVEYNSVGEKIHEYRGSSSYTAPVLVVPDLGIKLFYEDRLEIFPSAHMGIGSIIKLQRAPEITILDGKHSKVVRSWQKTVGDLLDEQRVELLPDDKINFSLSTEVEDQMQIKITRVAITQVFKTQPIDFKIIQKDDKNLDKGKTRIDQAGVKGEKKLTYEVRREDGDEVSRKLIKTETTLVAVDQILIIGTKPVITGWCKYNDLVLDASIKNGLDPDRLCALMHKESNGHVDSVSGGGHLGLFQYTEGFWADASAKAGYSGAAWNDAKAQIYTTAWAITHGYAGRWPGTFK